MLNAIHIELPQSVFDRLQQVARQHERSIPDTVDVLLAQVESIPSLEDEVERELVALAILPDEVLLLLAQNPMPMAYQEELAVLNDRAQRVGSLSLDDGERQDYLLDYYQKAVLRRSYCLEILRRHGHDLRELLQLPNPAIV